MRNTKLLLFLLVLFSSPGYADCGGNNQKACHCSPEWYASGLVLHLGCDPYDRCDPTCTQHGSSTLLFGKFWNEATCTCPTAPKPIWSSWTSTPIEGWAEAWDKRYHLDQHMDWTKLNWVSELKPGMTQPIADGLYIYVFRTTDNKLLIRRSDRPDDIGIFSHGNKALYSYSGNPNGNNESPMFVRHTQLNGGWTPVWAAGQLEFYEGEVIWVSNASGHYQPKQPPTLDYVATALNEWNIPTINPLQKLSHGWEKKWTLVPNDGEIAAVATMGDSILLGVGTNNKLYSRPPFASKWVKAPDTGGQVIAITVMQNNTILGVGTDKKLYTRQTLDSSWVKAPDKNGQVMAVTIMKNGVILGVGLDNKLYTRQTLNNAWVKAPDKGGAVKAVTIMNDGSILAVGMNNQLYTRPSLNEDWVNIPNSGSVVGVTIINDESITDPNKVQRIIGVDQDNKIWIRLPPKINDRLKK